MADVLVVADDLTGANACAAGFSRAGLRAVTVGLGRRWDAIAEFHELFDVVVATTESRHSAPDDAAEAVTQAVRAGWPVRLVSVRIDTTLRGNVGVSAQAALAVTRELSGGRVVGLCLPAHPTADRVTVQGNQLLAGVRLEDTELARDVRTPITTSSVAQVLGQGTDLRTALLPLDVVTGSQDEIVDAIVQALADEPDVIVADALTPDHLTRVAQAAAAAAADVTWVGIDPGPGSVAIAGALDLHAHAAAGVCVGFSGSATELTRLQLDRLLAARDVVLVRPVPQVNSPLPDVDASAMALCDAIAGALPGQIVLFATVLSAADLLPLSDEESAELPRVLGRIARRMLQEAPVDGLYTTGGDITAAVLEEIGGRGIEVQGEVVPLAVAGEVVGGAWAGLPIVTKGGLVGGPDTAIECLDELQRAAAARSRAVRSAVPREPHSPL